ncbi:hypothetical protein [Flavobacterium sp. XGLA_31]|uniref:hypothetical protein n=1 Tax=Flavobacterium sp. XGLA_31 TaxID=3447666 RepID=UPI003F3AE99D
MSEIKKASNYFEAFFLFISAILYSPYVKETVNKIKIPPSNGDPGGGGGVDGGGGAGAANKAVNGSKSTTKEVRILFGTIFIVRKSKKKFYLPKYLLSKFHKFNRKIN